MSSDDGLGAYSVCLVTMAWARTRMSSDDGLDTYSVCLVTMALARTAYV